MKKIIKFKLPVDIALQLFDQLVLPVLLYGSEVWCFTKIDQIEIFYRKCLKELLGVSKCTTNVMVYGETGTLYYACAEKNDLSCSKLFHIPL